jgi:hypothetical protein
MKDTSGFAYNDLRVIGGNSANANQDGMDWLGGGDTTVRDSFLRASDDDFALEGNWDGYTDAEMVRPGNDVQNILIEHSELSTSISNIVRAGWPRKTFNSRNFTLRDSDILHGGIGACGQNFSLFAFWSPGGATGDHSNYNFENLMLDNWYSLVQVQRDQPQVHGIAFRNIWALDQPPLASSSLLGKVSDVSFDNVKFGQKVAASGADLPLVTANGAEEPTFAQHHGPVAAFTIAPTVFTPGQEVEFTAQEEPNAHYTWLFGDGTQAVGRRVVHRFPDAEGTELDGGAVGAGRFRVLLHVESRNSQRDSFNQDWAAQGVVVVGKWHEAVTPVGAMLPGVGWQVYPGSWNELPNLAAEQAVFSGDVPNLRADPQGFKRYAVAWDGFIDIPADGGYTFHLEDRDGARLVIDGVEVAKTGQPFAQVCGSAGNAMRYDRGSLGLRAGRHSFHLEGLHSISEDWPRLLWEGPALPLTDVPQAAFSHLRQDAIKAGYKVQGAREKNPKLPAVILLP